MINKKDSKWKSLKDFQALAVNSANPIVVCVDKQVSNPDKVTLYWEEESSSSLFDESETFKVSISIQLAELLIKSGLAVKQGKDTSTEEEFMKILLEKIAAKNATAEKQD